MNIIGYYDTDDIWVPDPHEKEFTYHKVINEYLPKPEKIDDANTSFVSDIESNGGGAFKLSTSMQYQPMKLSNERRGFGNTFANLTSRETEGFEYENNPLNTTA